MCICIFVGVMHVVRGQVCSGGDWAMLKAPELTFLQGLLFSSLINAVSTMGKCHCSFLLYYLLFGVHHSMVINDPFQKLHTADISFFARLSEGNQKLLLWQQSELVNCQLKDCSSTSWNLLSHGWKKEPL